jgi:hypothetical protein
VKALVIGICLLGCAGLWGWALLGQEPVEPVPEDLQGRFELFRFEAPQGTAEDPLAQGQRWVYEFTADNRFILRVLVDNGIEMSRSSGTILPAGKERVLLTHISENAEPIERRAESFKVIRAYDEKGPYINLAQELEGGTGIQLMLRKLEP